MPSEPGKLTWAEVKARCRAGNRKPTIDEILACQDELARVFEEWEPRDGGRPVVRYGDTLYALRIHNHPDDEYHLWAEVVDLPGCFASGRDEDELRDALREAIGLYLSGKVNDVR